MSAATAETLTEDLQRIGVRRGMTLMVHASMRKLRPVDGGAATVIEALDRAVGPDGVWVMVLGTEPAVDGVVFDPAVSIADPDVGVLAEVFRRTPGTIVNDHPEARFGARGERAAAVLTGLPWHDYYGPGSVLHRLHDAGGAVLRLGSDPDTMTVLHYAEYRADVAGKRRVRRHSVIAHPDGPKRVFVDCLDDSDGIVDWPGEDYFAVITRAYIAEGRAAGTGRVGSAASELVDAQDFVAFGAAWMTERFSDEGSSPARGPSAAP